MAARKWTAEQRQQQAEQIRTWSPWEKSTGPQSLAGKQSASRNAFCNSLRPRLRELSKSVNVLLRNHSDMLRQL